MTTKLLLATILAVFLFAPRAFAAPEDLPPLPASTAVDLSAGPLVLLREDTVYLRSGGMVRGRLEEVLPNDHVTIVLQTREVRKIPWGDVARVIVASAPDAPGFHPLPEKALAPPMEGPLVHVHIRSPRTVQLLRRPAGTTGWTNACASPCDKELPLGDDYSIAGSGAAQSAEFRLRGARDGKSDESIELVVSPTSTAGMITGGLLAGVGGYVMYLGLLALPASESDAGYAAIALGAGGALVGTVILIASVGTSVSQESPSKKTDAFVRQPFWRGPPRNEQAARATTLTLFARSF